MVATMEKEHHIWVALRVLMGFTFLWAFLDKLLGLGFSTCRDKATGAVTYMCSNAWIYDGSPTKGFLSGVKGPFAGIFNAIAGNPIVNVLFMVGLLGIGLALLLGMGTKIAGYSGALLVFLMYLAALSSGIASGLMFGSNPLFDEHITEMVILLGLAFVNPGQWCGLGKWWTNTNIVKKYPWLQ
jgi:thiosulfate dehydrogenase [quinone] large subunit